MLVRDDNGPAMLSPEERARARGVEIPPTSQVERILETTSEVTIDYEQVIKDAMVTWGDLRDQLPA